jgi:predicted dehydrogenase
MSVPIGVALVGLGMWGRRVGAAASRSPGVRLVSCFARDRETREDAARSLGCRPAPSLGSLLDDPEVEAVLVITPNHVHREIVAAAAERGRHVFVEKPIADTLESAEAIRQACRSAGVVLFVGHCFRRLGASRAAERLVASGALGTVVLAEATFSLPGAFAPGSWRSRRQTLAGGPLTQLGIHHADTLQHWLGPAGAVHGSLVHLAASADIDDVAVAMLEHRSGARSVIACSYVSPKTYAIRLSGTLATLELRTDMSIWPAAERMDASTSLLLHGPDGGEEVRFEPIDMLVDELRAFARCIRNGNEPETGGSEGVAALRVILGAVASSAEGRAVAIGEEAHAEHRPS